MTMTSTTRTHTRKTETMAKRVLDQFDMEAEREGNAIKGHTVIRRGWGKGITKQRNMHKRGNEILTTRIVKREGWLK